MDKSNIIKKLKYLYLTYDISEKRKRGRWFEGQEVTERV